MHIGNQRDQAGEELSCHQWDYLGEKIQINVVRYQSVLHPYCCLSPASHSSMFLIPIDNHVLIDLAKEA
jgi:hypothetical protein